MNPIGRLGGSGGVTSSRRASKTCLTWARVLRLKMSWFIASAYTDTSMARGAAQEGRASGSALTGLSACDQESVACASKISFGYDARDRLTSTVYGDGSPGVSRSYTPDGLPLTVESSGITWTYGYNNRRLLNQELFSLPGQSPGQGWNFTWGVDAHGNVSSFADPWGAIAYGPDALGHPTQVAGVANNITHHPNGAVASYTLVNGITHTVSQNLRGLPELWRDAGAVGVVQDRYVYDPNGNVASITDEQEGVSSRAMGYDGLDRLTQANSAGVWGTGSFGYDTLDNLRSSTMGDRTLSHNIDAATNRLVSLTGSQNISIAYDTNGNITQRGVQGFVFDIGNRLLSAPGKANYTYDGHGRRSWKGGGPDGSAEWQVYSQAGRLLLGSHNMRGDTRYVYLGDKLIGEYNTLTGTSFSHTDMLGSPVAKTNLGGQVISPRTRYEPYGATAAGTNPVGIGFTGHVNDADTGLVYMQQRYYDAIAGRFLSVDPVTTDAKSGGHFGRYHYAENNPYRYVDPDGRDAVAVTFPDYRISFGGTTWSNLGHAGALLINPANGVTRYYDFGRYGGTTGIVRNLPLSSNVVMSGGVPTTASLAQVLTEVSKLAGNGGRIDGAYFSGANFSAMNSYAQGLVGKTVGNGGYGEWSPLCSCNTFQRDILREGGVDTPSMVDPRPNSYIKELQGAPGAQSFGFGGGGFQGVFRVSGRIESRRLDRELSR